MIFKFQIFSFYFMILKTLKSTVPVLVHFLTMSTYGGRRTFILDLRLVKMMIVQSISLICRARFLYRYKKRSNSFSTIHLNVYANESINKTNFNQTDNMFAYKFFFIYFILLIIACIHCTIYCRLCNTFPNNYTIPELHNFVLEYKNLN